MKIDFKPKDFVILSRTFDTQPPTAIDLNKKILIVKVISISHNNTLFTGEVIVAKGSRLIAGSLEERFDVRCWKKLL